MTTRASTPVDRLPPSLWFLSIGAFFLNLASVMCFSLTPILLRSVFHSNTNTIGMLEGGVEGVSLLVRSFTGLLSDFFGRRKVFLVWGYGISVLSRFLLAPATLIEQVFLSRFVEKVGNGLQASPREAYISDISPESMIGRAYSLNKTWSMSGSLTGGALMMVAYFMKGDAEITRVLLWFAAACTAVAFLILVFGTKDSEVPTPSVHKKNDSLWAEIRKAGSEIAHFSRYFWMTIGIVCLFKMGLFSGTFLMRQLYGSNATFFGHALGKSEFFSNSVFQVVQCVSCAFFAYPMGCLSDRVDRRITVALACVFMITAIFLFSKGASSISMYLGIISYGLQYSLHGSLMAWLSLVMPRRLFGTGFGIFYFTSGLAIILSNWLLTYLSDTFDRRTAFLILGSFVVLALALIPFVPGKDRSIDS